MGTLSDLPAQAPALDAPQAPVAPATPPPSAPVVESAPVIQVQDVPYWQQPPKADPPAPVEPAPTQDAVVPPAPTQVDRILEDNAKYRDMTQGMLQSLTQMQKVVADLAVQRATPAERPLTVEETAAIREQELNKFTSMGPEAYFAEKITPLLAKTQAEVEAKTIQRLQEQGLLAGPQQQLTQMALSGIQSLQRALPEAGIDAATAQALMSTELHADVLSRFYPEKVQEITADPSKFLTLVKSQGTAFWQSALQTLRAKSGQVAPTASPAGQQALREQALGGRVAVQGAQPTTQAAPQMVFRQQPTLGSLFKS